MSSTLACIGLDVPDMDALAELLNALVPKAERLGRADGVDVLRWQDPSGARLVFGLGPEGFVDFVPSFAGRVGARLAGLQRANEEVTIADVVDADGERLTMLAAEFEQRRLLDPPPPVLAASVVALGVDVDVFADEREFAASPASLLNPDDEDAEPPADLAAGAIWPPRLGAQSFLSYGIWGDPAEARAEARLSGTVVGAGRRTVARTGQAFQAVRVNCGLFEADVCLSAAEHPFTPMPGQVLSGHVFLVVSVPRPA